MLLLSHSASSQDAQHADDTSEKQAGADQSPKTSEDSLTIEAPAQSRPDEAIDGPVCFISGGEDPIWPASRLAELGIDRLDGANFDYAYEHRRYDDAGHFITPPYLPKSADLFGGPAAAMARADADAWPAVLDCLDRGLRS